MWWIFFAIIVTLLVIDLGLFKDQKTPITTKQSIYLSSFYIGIGCLFGLWVAYNLGAERAEEYYAAFFIEKALAIDNIFIIAVIFRFCGVHPRYQHKVLLIGILSVLVLRGIMIYLGAKLVANFEAILYLFGAFLVYTGVQILIAKDHLFAPEDSPIVNFVKKHIRITTHKDSLDKLWFYEDKKLYFTNLTLALILIELIDLIMAIDSIPAVLAISNDTYVIYTSNIFAILGLRAMFFCVVDIIDRFKYLKYSLGIVLIFIGAKIFIEHIVGKIPTLTSLVITCGILLSGVILSIVTNRKKS
jgi:tellurite resistance protein TerC